MTAYMIYPRYESPVVVEAVTSCEGWILRRSNYQKMLKFFPLSARLQVSVAAIVVVIIVVVIVCLFVCFLFFFV